MGGALEAGTWLLWCGDDATGGNVLEDDVCFTRALTSVGSTSFWSVLLVAMGRECWAGPP